LLALIPGAMVGAWFVVAAALWQERNLDSSPGSRKQILTRPCLLSRPIAFAWHWAQPLGGFF